MILFEKVRWKNFLSTGNQFTEIDFLKNSTNLIIGTNGAGKSTVLDDEGDRILYLFEAEDDAMRFAMMLEEDGSPTMHVLEIEDDIMIKTCEIHDYSYTIITPNDIVIPPNTNHDFI